MLSASGLMRMLTDGHMRANFDCRHKDAVELPDYNNKILDDICITNRKFKLIFHNAFFNRKR